MLCKGEVRSRIGCLRSEHLQKMALKTVYLQHEYQHER